MGFDARRGVYFSGDESPYSSNDNVSSAAPASQMSSQPNVITVVGNVSSGVVPANPETVRNINYSLTGTTQPVGGAYRGVGFSPLAAEKVLMPLATTIEGTTGMSKLQSAQYVQETERFNDLVRSREISGQMQQAQVQQGLDVLQQQGKINNQYSTQTTAGNIGLIGGIIQLPYAQQEKPADIVLGRGTYHASSFYQNQYGDYPYIRGGITLLNNQTPRGGLAQGVFGAGERAINFAVTSPAKVLYGSAELASRPAMQATSNVFGMQQTPFGQAAASKEYFFNTNPTQKTDVLNTVILGASAGAGAIGGIVGGATETTIKSIGTVAGLTFGTGYTVKGIVQNEPADIGTGILLGGLALGSNIGYNERVVSTKVNAIEPRTYSGDLLQKASVSQSTDFLPFGQRISEVTLRSQPSGTAPSPIKIVNPLLETIGATDKGFFSQGIETDMTLFGKKIFTFTDTKDINFQKSTIGTASKNNEGKIENQQTGDILFKENRGYFYQNVKETPMEFSLMQTLTPEGNNLKVMSIEQFGNSKTTSQQILKPVNEKTGVTKGFYFEKKADIYGNPSEAQGIVENAKVDFFQKIKLNDEPTDVSKLVSKDYPAGSIFAAPQSTTVQLFDTKPISKSEFYRVLPKTKSSVSSDNIFGNEKPSSGAQELDLSVGKGTKAKAITKTEMIFPKSVQQSPSTIAFSLASTMQESKSMPLFSGVQEQKTVTTRTQNQQLLNIQKEMIAPTQSQSYGRALQSELMFVPQQLQSQTTTPRLITVPNLITTPRQTLTPLTDLTPNPLETVPSGMPNPSPVPNPTPPPPTPTGSGLPKIPTLTLFESAKEAKMGARGRKYQYSPSVEAVVFNIEVSGKAGKKLLKSKASTGLGVRPIVNENAQKATKIPMFQREKASIKTRIGKKQTKVIL